MINDICIENYVEEDELNIERDTKIVFRSHILKKLNRLAVSFQDPSAFTAK